ncbi:MAG: hypothetical protein PHE53_13865 [Thermoguttaceae bacterium]|nr:hypothetical protein [Thermoguttaceae bacterium]
MSTLCPGKKITFEDLRKGDRVRIEFPSSFETETICGRVVRTECCYLSEMTHFSTGQKVRCVILLETLDGELEAIEVREGMVVYAVQDHIGESHTDSAEQNTPSQLRIPR